ncbi:chloride channel protein [Marinobacteraceae bacterium S3BR75-40.1]
MTKRHSYRRKVKYILLRSRREGSRRFGSLQDWKIQLIFWMGALMVGLTIQLFAIATEHASEWFEASLEYSRYTPLVTAPLGMMLVVWVMTRVSMAVQGSGIPQVLLVIKQRYSWLRPAFLSIRVAATKLVLTCAGLMFGASIGREGPSVHIGAAIMHRVGKRGALHKRYLDNSLIVAGGAAGVAAAFNAPMAGIVFAIEELSQSFEQRTSGTLIVAIILSGVVVLAMSGHYSYFGNAKGALPLETSWYAIIITAIICGALGGLFGLLLVKGTHWLAPHLRRYPLRIAAACGLIVALIGFMTGGVTYGSGYEQAKVLITGEESGDWLFPIAKFAATLVSYYSGIPGGLFSPSLATGAGLGALIGEHLPGVSVTAITVVAMASYLSGVIQRPITSFVIVLELTGNNHEFLLPLMAGAFIAYGASKLVHLRPLYDALAHGLAEGAVHPLEVDATKDAGKATKEKSEASVGAKLPDGKAEERPAEESEKAAEPSSETGGKPAAPDAATPSQPPDGKAPNKGQN